ncbi:MAG: class I SAM-dependent methyltransferase, partial [Gemmatimonadales bacterium]
LDTFAQRCPPPLAERLTVFEVDQPDTQGWKRRRLRETGHGEPANARYVPVDFETGQSWVDAIVQAGFDAGAPAVVSALGVTQYITESATTGMLRSVAGLAPGTAFACGFNPPDEEVRADERLLMDTVLKMVADRGCPWIGRYTAAEFTALAAGCGFARTEVVDGTELGRRYFARRPDGLVPIRAESFLLAHVD